MYSTFPPPPLSLSHYFFFMVMFMNYSGHIRSILNCTQQQLTVDRVNSPDGMCMTWWRVNRTFFLWNITANYHNMNFIMVVSRVDLGSYLVHLKALWAPFEHIIFTLIIIALKDGLYSSYYGGISMQLLNHQGLLNFWNWISGRGQRSSAVVKALMAIHDSYESLWETFFLETKPNKVILCTYFFRTSNEVNTTSFSFQWETNHFELYVKPCQIEQTMWRIRTAYWIV